MQTQIPAGGQMFRVNEKGIGTENVYIVATSKALGALEASLRKFASGSVEQIDKDALLAGFSAMSPGEVGGDCGTKTRDLELDAPAAAAAPGCTKSRGLVLDDAPAAGQPVSHSMEARTAAGDDTIVKVFPFRHVRENEYAAELAQYNAPTPEGA